MSQQIESLLLRPFTRVPRVIASKPSARAVTWGRVLANTLAVDPISKATNDLGEIECSWCGGVCDQPRPYLSRAGEVFCSPGHRSSSNRALRRLVGR